MAEKQANDRQQQPGSGGERSESREGEHPQAGGKTRGKAGDEQGRGARVTQGNLGTTQREWKTRDPATDADEGTP